MTNEECDRIIADLKAENEKLRAACKAAWNLEDVTWKVKNYPSNRRYQRQLKEIHDQLKEAQRIVGGPE